MQIVSTADVSLPVLRDFAASLPNELTAEVNEGQVHQLSLDPPSWVAFWGSFDWWIPLKAGATAFLVAYMTSAGKAAWKSTGRLAGKAKEGIDSTLEGLSRGIARLRDQLPSRTELVVGLPIPDNYFGTRLTLSGTDQDSLLIEIALFIVHLPQLEALITTEQLGPERVATGIDLNLLPDASLEVKWHDRGTLQDHTRVLPLPDVSE